MLFSTQTLLLFVIPALWGGFCLGAFLFRDRLKHRPRVGRSALVLAVVAGLIFAAELGVGLLLRDVEKPSSYTGHRNPHLRRDWTAFTAPKPGPKEEYRVILISNSQGFLRERSEGELTYAGRLETALRAGGYGEGAEVLNWSVPGASAQELIVLAARAVAHEPDVVMLVSYNNNFSVGAGGRRLASGGSDIPHMGYLPEVRRFLPGRFLDRADAYDGLDWLGAHSNLIRWRNRNMEPEEWVFVPREPGPNAPLRTFSLTKNVMPELLEDFLTAATAGETVPEVLLVSMPLNHEQFKGFENVGQFAEVAQAAADKIHPQAQVHDASQLYPPEDFYGGRHLRLSGHEKFAAYLYDRMPEPNRD